MDIKEEFRIIVQQAAEDYGNRSRSANLFEDYIFPALENAGLEVVRKQIKKQSELFKTGEGRDD